MKVMLILMAMLIAANLLNGCAPKGHKISFDAKKVFNCPKRARAGETVRFETVLVCDADLYANIDGVEVQETRTGRFEFIMPDHDVEIRITIIANGRA